MPTETDRPVLSIGDLRIDAGSRKVWIGGAPLALPRLSFDLLLALAEAAPDALSTDELMERVWNGLVVSPATIAKRVELLRQALGDSADHPRYVELVRGYGYRMASDVTAEGRPEPAAPGPASASETVRPATEKESGAGSRRWRWALASLAVLLIALVTVVVKRVPPPPPERSIAVLPFRALGSEPADQWFAEGLTEEITHMLGRSGELRVTGHQSAVAAARAGEDVQGAGEALGVAHVLEGSVRRDGQRIRVVARLLATADGYQLWSETFDVPEGELLAIQRMIADRLAQRFGLEDDMIAPPDRSRTSSDPTAYALYLQAVGLSPWPQGYDLARAQALAEEAVARDPGFAPGWNRLAAIHGRRLFFDRSYPLAAPDAMRVIGEAVERALAIDPDIGEAYANMAGLAWAFDQDLGRAAGLLEQAARLDPWNLEVIAFARDFARAIGDIELSLQLGAYILSRDPLCPGCRSQYAGTLECAGEMEAAEQQLALLDEASSSGDFAFPLGRLRLLAGDLEMAEAQFTRVSRPEQQLAARALLAHARGEEEQAQGFLAELVTPRYASHWALQAQTAATLGEDQLALERLQSALPQQFVFVQGSVCGPTFDRLHDYPEWSELMLDLGFTAEGEQAVPFTLPVLPERAGPVP